MQEAIRQEIIRKKVEGEESNPFVRRKCNPRMVTKPSIQSSEDLQRALAAAAEKENQEKAARAAAVADAERSMKGPPSKKSKTDGGAAGDDASKEDLFDAHDFDIEIDVDTNDTVGVANVSLAPAVAVAGVGGGGGTLKGSGGPKSVDSGPSKKSLNLDAYKKKRGLI